MPPAITQPKDKPNWHQQGTGTIWKGFPSCSPRVPPGSSCLSHLPALHPPEDAHERTRQIEYAWGLGGPTLNV